MASSSIHLPALLAGVLVAIYVTSVAYGRIVLYVQRRKFKREHGCQPITHKFPLKDPFLGIDDILAKMKSSKEHKLLERGLQNFRRIGNTFSSHAFGHNLIATIEPQNIKTVLSLSFKEYGIAQRQHTLGPLLGYGIFTTDGELWAHSRAMIRPNFSRDQVGDLAAFERHIQHLFKIIPRDGSTVDLQELFFQFTIDSATEFLFGQSTNTLKSSGVQGGAVEANFAKAFNRAQSACATRARMGLLRSVYRDPAGDEAIRICHEFVDQFVDEAVRYREDIERKGLVKEGKYVFLHELAKSTKDKRRLRDELLNVLLAGRDTTASLLSNMWFMIAKQPEIYAKLRREVEETLHGELPSYEQLRNMKYLKFCMNESLRIHPVVPGNSRVALTDSFLPLGGGADGKSPVFVAKGTIVLYSPYTMHRRPDFYGPNAEEFLPDRWETLRPGWEYLPFNGGPRICLGQQYALTEAGYVTVRLIQEFKGLESRDPEPWIENLTLTLCSLNGTKVGLTPA